MADNNNNNFTLISGIIVIAIVVGVIFLFMFQGTDNSQKQTAVKETKQVQQPQKEVSQPQQTPQASVSAAPFVKYKYTYTYTFNINGRIKNFDFTIPVPNNEKEKQYISDFSIEPKPTSIEKEGGNIIAKYSIPRMETGQFKVVLQGIANIRTYNIKTAKLLNKNISPESDLTKYLAPEKYIESDDPYIVNIAKKIKGDTKEEILQNIYIYIQDNMQYKIIQGTLGAKKALQSRYGKCSEYAAIMTALLRAKGIPARIVSGNIARDNDTPHAWVEVYFDEYGWVAYEPTFMPIQMKILAPDGKLLRVEKKYEVSHDEQRYVKSAINLFSPYMFKYSMDERNNGRVSVDQKIEIKKVN